jgi:transcriptional regulator with XRE-family HTH domain
VAGARRVGHASFVSPEELISTRQRLGLTHDAMAAELNLTPAVVIAWERGRIKPARRVVQWLTWRAGMLDRDAALAASGLPECAELHALHAATGTDAESPRERRARMDAVLAHLAQCPACIARRRYIEERFPPMPRPPMAASVRLLVWVFDWVTRTRAWIRRKL